MHVVKLEQRSLQIHSGTVARETCSTTLAAWDELVPHGGFARGSVHEFLFDEAAGSAAPSFPALLAARGMLGASGPLLDKTTTTKTNQTTTTTTTAAAAAAFTSRKLVWCDGDSTLYPPAIASAGFPLDRLCIIRPRPAEMTWAVAECLRCTGVGVVVARMPARLSRVEVRRLQLAAERGGGVGVMLRPLNQARKGDVYAAATRWLISPAPGDRLVQRWTVQLIHGHGGHQGQSIVLEARRGYASLHPSEHDVAARLSHAAGSDVVAAHPVHPSAALARDAAGAAAPRASA